MFNKNLGHWLPIIFLMLIISSCTRNVNVTKDINNKLSSEIINSKLEYQKIDLSLESKCSTTTPLNVINSETRQDKYIIFESGPMVCHIVPIEFIDNVVKYTNERLVESNLILTNNLGKKIYISLEEVKVEGGFVKYGIVQLKIQIPEINYNRAYNGKDGSGMFDSAIAYATHHAVTAFINDPVFQKYVKCQ
jgi:hypothetical protein